MATTKVTFTFDPATIVRLDDAAQRLAKPKSEIVREAIHEYLDVAKQITGERNLREVSL